ncbi:MAG: tetratricopeptide repeat protein, partial [Candidatus Omnitrophica bacterium]|nr:tetratricopeptide repeat protein [Candidatus Omnitrophota bacterium]
MDRTQAQERLIRARELADSQEYAPARSELETILLSITDDPAIYFELGKVCVSMKDSEEAKYALSRCLQLDPDHTEAAELMKEVAPDHPVGPPAPPSFNRIPHRDIPVPGGAGAPNGPWIAPAQPSDSGLDVEEAIPSPMGPRVLAYFIDRAFFFFASIPLVSLFYAVLML